MDEFDYIKIKNFSSLKDINKVKAIHRLGEDIDRCRFNSQYVGNPHESVL